MRYSIFKGELYDETSLTLGRLLGGWVDNVYLSLFGSFLLVGRWSNLGGRPLKCALEECIEMAR